MRMSRARPMAECTGAAGGNAAPEVPAAAPPADVLLKLCGLPRPPALPTLEHVLHALGDPFATQDREAWVTAYRTHLSAQQRAELWWEAASLRPLGPNAIGLMFSQLTLIILQGGLGAVMPCGSGGLTDSQVSTLVDLTSHLFRNVVTPPTATSHSAAVAPTGARVAAAHGYDAGVVLAELLALSPKLCDALSGATGARGCVCLLQPLATIALDMRSSDQRQLADPLLSAVVAGVMTSILRHMFALPRLATSAGSQPANALATPLPCDVLKALLLMVRLPQCMALGLFLQRLASCRSDALRSHRVRHTARFVVFLLIGGYPGHYVVHK